MDLQDRLLAITNEINDLKIAHKYGLGTFTFWSYSNQIRGSFLEWNTYILLYYKVKDPSAGMPAITIGADDVNVETELYDLIYQQDNLTTIIFFIDRRDNFLPHPVDGTKVWVRSTAELVFDKMEEKTVVWP